MKNDQKRHLAALAERFAAGKIGRRRFLRDAALLGFAAGGAGLLAGRRPLSLFPTARAAGHESSAQAPEVTAWLKDVGSAFRGKNVVIKYATEATPPSQVLSTLVADDFTRHTGIEVQVEIVPLEQVLQKLTQDVAGGLGSYDLYYLDQSWMASFSNDTVDPREIYAGKPDLAMPNYDFDDFLPPLTEGISMFRGKMVGVPFDIPIFIVMYRKDIYDKLGLVAPTTYPHYLENARAVQKAMGGEIFGTTGQMKSGHYSLECDWTNWLWGHGGSIFGPDGKFAGNDERGIEAMEYWIRLKENMPPDVLNWTWDGEFTSMAQGLAAQVYSWGEFFPGLDNPENSEVAGLPRALFAAATVAPAQPRRSGARRNPRLRAPRRQRARGLKALEEYRRGVGFRAVGIVGRYEHSRLAGGRRRKPHAAQHLRRRARARQSAPRRGIDPPFRCHPQGDRRQHGIGAGSSGVGGGLERHHSGRTGAVFRRRAQIGQSDDGWNRQRSRPRLFALLIPRAIRAAARRRRARRDERRLRFGSRQFDHRRQGRGVERSR